MVKILGVLLVLLCVGCATSPCPPPTIVKVPVQGECPSPEVRPLPDLPIFHLTSANPAEVVSAYQYSVMILMQEVLYYRISNEALSLVTP